MQVYIKFPSNYFFLRYLFQCIFIDKIFQYSLKSQSFLLYSYLQIITDMCWSKIIFVQFLRYAQSISLQNIFSMDIFTNIFPCILLQNNIQKCLKQTYFQTIFKDEQFRFFFKLIFQVASFS